MKYFLIGIWTCIVWFLSGYSLEKQYVNHLEKDNKVKMMFFDKTLKEIKE